MEPLVLFFATPHAVALRVPLSILAIFGTAKLFAEIFERLKQPGIVGEILAGVIIGPSALGWVEPTEFINTFSELGVTFLLPLVSPIPGFPYSLNPRWGHRTVRYARRPSENAGLRRGN